MPRGEYEHRRGVPGQEDRLASALETLETGIDAILDSEHFAAYLRTMARLPHYSFGNLVLIHAQHPAPTMVAGYRRWQELGRQVKKAEHGIKILVP
jgi:N-terminal domain of anti-restriction factor ArdC